MNIHTLLTSLFLLGLTHVSAADKKPALPEGVKVLRDLEYSKPGGKPLLLDLYLPETTPSKPLPVVLWVHGGGWKNGSKATCPGTWLVPLGYAVASIDYRLIPDHQWPAQMEDCHAALAWLRAHAAEHHLDGGHIAAWGGSSGGHMVAMMGTVDAPENLRVQAVVDWFGPSDLLTMPPNVLSDKRTREDLAKANGALLLGGIVMDQPEKARAASALHQASAGDAPFLIMHGTADTSVPVAQSQLLHEKLVAAGVESTLHIFPVAGHGGKDFYTPATRQLIQDFLDKHLKSPAR